MDAAAGTLFRRIVSASRSSTLAIAGRAQNGSERRHVLIRGIAQERTASGAMLVALRKVRVSSGRQLTWQRWGRNSYEVALRE